VGPVDWKIEVLAEVRAYPQDYLFVTPALRPSEVWKTLPWKKFQRNVFRLQKRILRQAQDRFYRAKQQGADDIMPLWYNGQSTEEPREWKSFTLGSGEAVGGATLPLTLT